ncbi:MAG: rRNA maturation RNase YbeY [Cyanobacteria bacterium J06576_12]
MELQTRHNPMQVEAFVDGESAGKVTDLTPSDYKTWLQRWLIELNPKLLPINAYEVGLRLTDDATIQQLNSDYRQKNKPTDVLSFAALETTLPGADDLYQEQPIYIGDIIISIETATRQAVKAEHSLAQEVAWLTAHGLLHLLGWDHPDDDSLEQMLDQQAHLLSLVSIS